MKRTPSQYSRFLLSTCLPVFAFTLCNAPIVHAGFEWTPPPQVEPAPLPPIETKDAVVPEDVISEPLSDVIPQDLTETQEPAIEIKVLDDVAPPTMPQEEAEVITMPVEEMPTIEIEQEEAPVAVLPEPDAPVELTQQPEAQEELVVEDIIEIDETAEEVAIEIEVQEEPVQEITVTVEEIEESIEEPVSDVEVDVETESSNSLDINPYPLENSETEEAEEAVIEAEAPKETIYWNAPENYDVIEGFGADMPLALALRQIVPPSYAFSFGEGINPGTKISWNGGKPWNEVLKDALAPLGVSFDVQNSKLLLRRIPMKADSETATPIEDTAEAEETITEQQETSLDSVIDDVIQAETETTPLAKDVKDAVVENAVIEIVEPTDIALETVHQQEESVSAPAPTIIAEETQEQAIEIIGDDTGMKPVEILEETAEAIPAPDYKALSEPLESPAEEAAIQRKAVLDPGQIEGQQPEAQQSPKAPELLDEKKNELAALQEATEEKVIELSSVDPVASISETVTQDDDTLPAETLEQIVPSTAPEAPAYSPYRATPSNEVKVWDVKSGASLQSILQKWAQDENVQIMWETAQDYDVNTTLFINGTFENAVEVLLSKGVDTPPNYTITTDGTYTLRVTD